MKKQIFRVVTIIGFFIYAICLVSPFRETAEQHWDFFEHSVVAGFALGSAFMLVLDICFDKRKRNKAQ